MEMSQMNTLQQLIFYLSENGLYVLSQFWRHFLISIYGVVFSAVIAIPLAFGLLAIKN